MKRTSIVLGLVLTQACHLSYARFEQDDDAALDASALDAGFDGGQDAGTEPDGCGGECSPGASGSGLNACGNDAARTCSDACRWGAYGLAESAATCDYCDDDPAGLRERAAGFASVARSHELTSGVRLEGDADGTCFGTNCFVDLVNGGDGVGGSFVPDPLAVLGYGGGEVTLDMVSIAGGDSPGLGWAFVAYVDPPPSPILGEASSLGVNLSADGFAVEWSTLGVDSVRVRRLDATGADPVIEEASTGGQLAGPLDSAAIQQLTVTWAPDDPATPADETTVTVEHPCLAVPTCDPIGCGGSTGVPCGFTLRPGDQLRYGVVAASTTASPALFTLRSSTVELSRLCPG